MPTLWFSNRGQVIQTLLALVIAIFAGIKAWPDMKGSQYFSGGALLFYALVTLVLGSILLLIGALRKEAEQRSAANTQIDALPELLPAIPGGLCQQYKIWPERTQWFGYISSIIKSSSRLVVIESYFGNHDGFWHSLEERLQDNEQFEFVLLTLAEGSPAYRNCLEVTGAGEGGAPKDKVRIQRLKELQNTSPSYRQKKTLEFLTWNGHGPGSVVWWIANGKEGFGLGCWLQYPGNTDHTPWIVLQQGLLFRYLKLHCEKTLDRARSLATS